MTHLKDSVREAERLQGNAHKSVENAVTKAQEVHEQMVELSKEAARLREKGNTAHNSLTKSRGEEESCHQQFWALKYEIEGAIRVRTGVLLVDT